MNPSCFDSHVDFGWHSTEIANVLANSLASESFLLILPPQPPGGCRYWDRDRENEAGFLGAALPVPEEAALLIVRRGWSALEAGRYYGVSDDVINYRINVTGARRRVRRAG